MQPSTSQDALSQLQQFQASAKSPTDIYNNEAQQLGVPQAQQNISGLRGAIQATTRTLNNVAPSVMGRTANSLVTSAQANRQIGNEQAPISQQLSTQNTALGNATQDYGNAEQRAEAAANLSLQGQGQQESYLQNIYNALYSREQDAAKLAEQQREADMQAATARAAGSGTSGLSPSFNFGGDSGVTAPTPAAPPQSDAIKQQATTAVMSLLGTNNKNLIQQTISAIQKSAGYGNTYDKLKLQLIQNLQPDLLKAPPKPAPPVNHANQNANGQTFTLNNLLK